MINKNKISQIYLYNSTCFVPLALTFSIFVADLICVINSLIYLKKIINRKINIFNNTLIKILFLFWVYLLIRSFFTQDPEVIFKIFFYFRFILFGSLISKIFFYKKFIQLLKNYILVALLMVTISIYIEFFFKFNYFNSNPTLGRLSGIFGSELIVGSYLFRILAVYFAINFFLLNNKKSSLVMLFLVTPMIIASGERTAIIMHALFLILTYLFLIYLNKITLKNSIIAFISIIILSSFFFQFATTETKNRFLSLSSLDKIQHSYLNYKPVYETAYKIFQNNKIFGVGPKKFKYICNEKINFIENGCTTHPHNIALQLLSETGIVGIIFYLIIILTLIFKFIKIKNDNNTLVAQKYLIIIILLNFFPFTPSGNFFNNFLNLIYYLSIGLALNLFEKKINSSLFINMKNYKY
jgi:O-antigen ligase